MFTKFLLFSSQLMFVAPLIDRNFEKPVAMSVWHERCNKNTFALNDCNWCRCGANHQFICEARVCSGVDVFGHFNDAIQDIDVGMEGHGVWRSTDTACEPGVHYHRGSLLCVCGEDGVWPNPVCRDIFRVLHAVHIPESTKNTACSPTKLYLIGCNVCFCPSTGQLDESLCTKNECANDDPVLETDSVKNSNESNVHEIYAECKVDLKYQLGCRTCTCLRNNRLLCSDCTKTKEIESYCKTMPPHKIFNVECNLCYCNAKGHMVCSAKRCLGNGEKSARRLMDIDERYLELVDPPLDDHYCQIGTKYKKGCNTCICLENGAGLLMYACTLKSCEKNESLSAQVTQDCVLHTSYELNCLKCSCVSANGEKWQWCETINRCSTQLIAEVKDLARLHGYCEPLHIYDRNCNKCTCLSNGQTLLCTDEVCKKSPEPISVDLVPMIQRGTCPQGSSYKIDCNVCVCLGNGNALCSTSDCKKLTRFKP